MNPQARDEPGLLSYHNEHHLELGNRSHGMGLSGWQDDGLPLLHLIARSRNGDVGRAINHIEQSVVSRSMLTEAFAFIKCE